MEANPQLKKFIAPYDVRIQKLALELRGFVLNLLPEVNELIWDNYNAVAIAYSKSDKLKDAFCHISVYAQHVNFGFNRGAQLTNPAIKLNGKGKLIRHISLKNFKEFPKEEMEKLILEAVMISESLNSQLFKPNLQSKSIVMSVSANKIRPNRE